MMYFSQLNIKYFIKKTLENLKINELTKIQEESLPLTLKHKSVIITSQTGSGKTLCYLVPILNNIQFTNKTQALIILPTKELARQVYSKILEFKNNEHQLRASLVLGNSNIEQQKQSIKNNPPQIIVGTTIRIYDLLNEKIINRNIQMIALDEVDMLMDQGFVKQIDQILDFINNPELQKIACSATTHESLANRFSKHFKDTKVIATNKNIWSNQQVIHNIVYTNDNADPLKTLGMLLKNINPYFCIIFANTKNEADDIYQFMLRNKYTNTALLHKNLSTRQRKHIFNDVNANKYQYLVATDIASRGIDIVGADVVISFGLPQEDIWYMHRIGRVGRYKDTGSAFIVYKKGIDNNIAHLQKKNINFHYYLLKDNQMISKELKLKLAKKHYFDKSTNDKIKQIINTNSQKIKPGYKKKIKAQIHKIKQKVKHEYIEKKIKQRLIQENIKKTKKNKLDR